jgi:hypothetical protein
MRFAIALVLGLLASSVGAVCMPPLNPSTLTPRWVVSDNPRGCWAGWWCPDGTPYIAAATKQQCSLVGVKRAVAAWLTSPSLDALTFGGDPFADPVLRDVWVPESSKLDAIR